MTVSAENQLYVKNPSLLDSEGNPAGPGNYVTAVFESDAGTERGISTVRQGDISENYRQRMAVDTLLFSETFLGAALNSAQFSSTLTTFATTVSGGWFNMNSASVVTASAVARLQSYKCFPSYGVYPLQFECQAYLNVASPQANSVCELGLGFALTTAAPTDGAFFRYNAAGEFRAVVVFNSVEIASAALTIPATLERHHYIIVINNDKVEFWVDNILFALIDVPIDNATASLGQQLPIMFRHYNTATPPALATQLKIGSVSITLGDMLSGRDSMVMQAGMGGGAFQGQTGGTMGSTANYANSAAAAAATLSNTAAGYTTLGGQFLFTTVAGAETDYALFAYQVPAAAITVASKSLLVTGVRISSMNIGAAVATTATVLQWSIGVGSTAVSLATAEAVTAKARRVYTLGIQSFPIAAAIAATQPDIDVTFNPPLMVEPGGFVHIILKLPYGTATASQQIRGTCLIQGVFE